jgi:hypothetical protein
MVYSHHSKIIIRFLYLNLSHLFIDPTAIRDRIKLTWLRGNQLSLSEEHDIIDNMLVLRNVQKSDQGLYNCIGLENDGTVVFSRSITLRVVGKFMFEIKYYRLKYLYLFENNIIFCNY